MIYFDDKGYPVAKDGDGGDSLHKWGVVVSLMEVARRIGVDFYGYCPYDLDLATMKRKGYDYVFDGRYHRHPTQWVEDKTSRDQEVMYHCARLLGGDAIPDDLFADNHEPLFMGWLRERARGFSTSRADTVLLGSIPTRFGWLPFLDSQSKNLSWGDRNDVSDDVLLSIKLMTANIIHPTWVSRKGLEWYAGGRPEPYGMGLYGARDNVEAAWAWYFKDGRHPQLPTAYGNGNPGIARLFFEVKRKLWKDIRFREG